MDEFPIWTLEEANRELPQLVALTETALERLEAARRSWDKLPFRAFDPLRGVAVEDGIRADWARAVARLGVQPKGYFVADFQSPDPDTLWCWSYGDEEIAHEHKHWETFADRRPVSRGRARDEPPEAS